MEAGPPLARSRDKRSQPSSPSSTRGGSPTRGTCTHAVHGSATSAVDALPNATDTSTPGPRAMLAPPEPAYPYPLKGEMVACCSLVKGAACHHRHLASLAS